MGHPRYLRRPADLGHPPASDVLVQVRKGGPICPGLHAEGGFYFCAILAPLPLRLRVSCRSRCCNSLVPVVTKSEPNIHSRHFMSRWTSTLAEVIEQFVNDLGVVFGHLVRRGSIGSLIAAFTIAAFGSGVLTFLSFLYFKNRERIVRGFGQGSGSESAVLIVLLLVAITVALSQLMLRYLRSDSDRRVSRNDYQFWELRRQIDQLQAAKGTGLSVQRDRRRNQVSRSSRCYS